MLFIFVYTLLQLVSSSIYSNWKIYCHPSLGTTYMLVQSKLKWPNSFNYMSTRALSFSHPTLYRHARSDGVIFRKRPCLLSLYRLSPSKTKRHNSKSQEIRLFIIDLFIIFKYLIIKIYVDTFSKL